MLEKRRQRRFRLVRAQRSAPLRLFPILVTMALLVPVQNLYAAVPTTTGTAHLQNTLTYGNTAYTVDYSYPSTVQVGTNLTILLTLHVISLTGLIEYVTAYRITTNVFVGNEHVLNSSVISNDTARYLYPGSTWGPNKFVFPLTADNTGVPKGGSANATVSVALQDLVYYAAPLYSALSEPSMVGNAGGFVVENSVATTNTSGGGQGNAQTYLPYALMASGAVLMLLAVVATRAPRPT